MSFSAGSSAHGPPDGQQVTVVDGDLLERAKENIVASREGRSANALSQVFSTPHAVRQKGLASSHACYKQLILDAKDVDPIDGDPLEPYCQYVKWINDNYPSGSSSESGLLPVLEEATRKFCDSPRYKNESKYVHLWMEYANLVEQTERVYAFMLANDIGSNWPHLYQQYALLLERNGNRSKADGVYRLGISRRVLGVERIKASYKEFQARCLVIPGGLEPPPPPPPTSRLVLGGREVLGARRGGPPAALTRSSVSMETPRSNIGKVPVYVACDPEPVDIKTNEWPRLGTKSETVKENGRPKSSLSNEPLHQKMVPPRDRFPVHRDEEISVPRTPSTMHTPDRVLGPHQASAHQDISRDPFKNYSQAVAFDFELPRIPDIPASPKHAGDIEARGIPTTRNDAPQLREIPAPSETSSRSHRPTSGSSAVGPKPRPSLPAPAPGKRAEIPAFATSQVWLDGEEYDRRESQARVLGLLNKKWPPPPVEEFDVPLRDESSAPVEVRKSLGKRRQSNTGGPTASPTTNTKAALSDVFSMFNTSIEEEVDGIDPPGQLGSPGSCVMLSASSMAVPFTPNPVPPSAKIPVWTPKERIPAPEVILSASLSQSAASAALADEVPIVPRLTSKTFSDPGLGSTESLLPGARGPTKFAMLQDNNAPRLPSVAKKEPSGAQESDLSREEPSVIKGHISSKPAHKITVFVDPSVDPSSVPAHSSGSPDNSMPSATLLFQEPKETVPIVDSLTENSSPNSISLPQSGSEGLEDVFGPTVRTSGSAASPPSSRSADTDDMAPPPVSTAWCDDAGEDESSEQNDQLPDVAPRSYEIRGGVAIMTPIAERTMEFGSNTKSLIRLTSPGPRIDNTPSKENGIVENLDSLKLEHENKSTLPAVECFEAPGPIDPFHPDNITQYINTVWGCLDTELYHDLRTDESDYGELFDKHTKKRSQRSRLGHSASEPPTPLLVNIGDASYEIFEKLGEGGFGAVFLARDTLIAEIVEEWAKNGEDDGIAPEKSELVALKVVKPAMQWEWVILETIREFVPDICPVVIKPRDLYLFKNESILVLDYSAQGTLLEAVNNASQIGIHSQDTFAFDELLVMFFTVELLRLLGQLHCQHFIHGDLKIDNCMLRLADPSISPLSTIYDPSGNGGWSDRGIRLIDFGRAIDVNAYLPGTSFTANWPADATDCIEIREGRPWTYQTDYAGVAGIVYCMMFGKYIQVIPGSNSDGQPWYRIIPSLKRYWQVDLWVRLFDLLLNSSSIRPGGELPLVEELDTVQRDMEVWLVENCDKKGKNLKHMLTKLYNSLQSRTSQ
ncbi:uncharacterized protein EI90DRAFT_3035307 [Cantharellus anzutake]|uniref:uncharacterized protein n=1 Tax=Cantharellus anzutake TaxID=1750568 RepID=UPI001908A72B|nr:uncharacterized protein EI90DRAFT_3035307 [Cantharellus anzutake]KAF8340360.1 hypothetical protein EI90DRAFT_3035307 [Cantharellus anzutake]